MRFQLNELRELIREAITKAYDILGVSPTADADAIKKAYRAKAVSLHPDRNAGKDTAADMVRLNVAYGILSDPEKRRKYDLNGDRTLGDFGQVNPFRQGQRWGSSEPEARPRPSSPKPNDWDPNTGRWDPNTGRERTKPKGTGPQGTNSPPPKSAWHGEENPPAYYTNTNGRSRKFWEVSVTGSTVKTRWGRMGTPGTTTTKDLKDSYKALKYMRALKNSKLEKGYVQGNAPRPSAWARPPSQKAPRTASSRGPGGGQAAYKVYPYKGARRVVRVGGKLFGTQMGGRLKDGGGGTKFQAGERAKTDIGVDGRMKVTKMDSDHSQTWDPIGEQLEAMIDDLVIESLLTIADE